VLEAMKHETIPPTIHCDDEIAASPGTPFRPVKEARPWHRRDRAARR
jgi:acyl transferase domain-containing protein